MSSRTVMSNVSGSPCTWVSKANRLRTLWQIGSDAEVAAALNALADYLDVKNAVDDAREDVGEDQIARIRAIAQGLGTDTMTPRLQAGPLRSRPKRRSPITRSRLLSTKNSTVTSVHTSEAATITTRSRSRTSWCERSCVI